MYTKDMNKRITLRFDDSINDFILLLCDRYECNPSEAVRHCIRYFKSSMESNGEVFESGDVSDDFKNHWYDIV